MGKGLIPVDLDAWKLRRRGKVDFLFLCVLDIAVFVALMICFILICLAAKSYDSLHYLEAMVKIFSACSEKIILRSEKLLRE